MTTVPGQEFGTAATVGAEARRLLRADDFRGRVLAQTTGACYLVGEDGDVLWLGTNTTPRHRRCIVVGCELPRLPAGGAFAVRGRNLDFGQGMQLRLRGAAVWRAPAVRAEDVLPAAAVAVALGELYRRICALPDSRGLGVLIPPIMATAFTGKLRAPLAGGPLLERAFASVAAIVEGCLCHDPAGVAKAAASLIGLGPGLTPSGDDFVGGLAFAAHHLGKAYPAACRWDGRPIAALVAGARARTNVVSHAILSDLAVGHGPEPLHGLLVSLLSGRQEKDAIGRALVRLVNVGHTSGWDLLAGFLTGTLLLAGACPRPRGAFAARGDRADERRPSSGGPVDPELAPGPELA